MVKLILTVFGRLVAVTPHPLLQATAWVLGGVITSLPGRRRTLYSNIHHAFPEWPERDRRRLARESSRRVIETGLLSLASPFLNVEQTRAIIHGTPSLRDLMRRQQTDPAPLLFASPHMAYWEIQTALPLLVDGTMPEMGVVFRPASNPKLDAWIKMTRERFGLRLLSRREGFAEVMRILRRRGIIGLLFDQNAGHPGSLTTLLDRVCSTTDLPGILATKFDARVYALYPRRLGFWQVEIHVEEITDSGSPAKITLALNRWLENKLRIDRELCASWLWLHARWKDQSTPSRRLRLEARRNLLDEESVQRGRAELPRRTRLWIRLPDCLSHVVMALPLLRAIRESRPDAEITLVAKAAFHSLLKDWQVADQLIEVPAKGSGYVSYFWRLRTRYPDCYLLFTNSMRGDLEAWLTRCPQRFGLLRPGKRRPLLTHRFAVPSDYDERTHHQLDLWTQFLNHFGLNSPPCLESLKQPEPNTHVTIGIIAGSENNPEKRWPISHWRELISQLPSNAKVLLFGTITDRAITDEINARLDRPVENLAGRTKLPEFCELLTTCTVLITNDTGGMHLANALGVPLIGLFGPTNPIRTGPVFSAPVKILQPAGCPPTGGASLNDLQPAQVLEALSAMIPTPQSSE